MVKIVFVRCGALAKRRAWQQGTALVAASRDSGRTIFRDTSLGAMSMIHSVTPAHSHVTGNVPSKHRRPVGP